MPIPRLAFIAILTVAAAGCTSEAERKADAAEDKIEQQAKNSAVASGDAQVALGLTERQLIDADLVAADGTELGDVAQVQRNAQGAVDGLLVEIENSDPDRFVLVPMNGLSARADGMGHDVQTVMTAQDLAALPAANLETLGAGAPAPK